LHTDARSLPNGTVLDADLCIVGAGASGITIARGLSGSNLKVLLLEGGGFDFDPQMQELYRGDIIGKPYYPLQAAALHFFGGTTGHWAGWCATYEPIDFEKRDWVPHSGWPITRADLDPFYARAQKVLELGPYKYAPADWKNGDAERVPLLPDSHLVHTRMWQFSPPTRFGQKYRSEIFTHPTSTSGLQRGDPVKGATTRYRSCSHRYAYVSAILFALCSFVTPAPCPPSVFSK
jgi:choline dehydrogenase-like flavoprotein